MKIRVSVRVRGIETVRAMMEKIDWLVGWLTDLSSDWLTDRQGGGHAGRWIHESASRAMQQ